MPLIFYSRHSPIRVIRDPSAAYAEQMHSCRFWNHLSFIRQIHVTTGNIQPMWTKTPHRAVQTAVFFTVPLLILLAWLPILPERAHLSSAVAQRLLLGELPPLANSTLWLGLLAVTPLPLASALSALGWGTTAVLLRNAIHHITTHPAAGWLPLLLLFSPLLPNTLGTAVPWQIALILYLLHITYVKRWSRQTLVLILLPLVWLSWLLLLLAVALLGWRWRESGRFPWRTAVGTAVTVVVAALLQRFVWQLSPTSLAVDLLLSSSLLLGLGLVALVLFTNWLQRGLQPRLPTLTPPQAQWGLTLLVGLPLLVVFGSRLWQQHQLRPVAQAELLSEAEAWLSTQELGETAVLVPPALVSQLNQPAFSFSAPNAPAEWSAFLNAPLRHAPTYVVSSNTLAWQRLIQTGWFQTRYQVAQQFADQASPTSPVTIWTYLPSPFDETDAEPMVVSADNGLQLVSHQTGPRIIKPGEAIYVTLNWQTAVPLSDNIDSIVRVISPLDQVGWAQQSLRTPRSLPPEWVAPNATTFPERFVLTTTTDIPVGAYQINLSLTTGRKQNIFTPLYQNNDVNPLDRILLGYLTVPWEGEVPAEATEVNGRYGDQMLLNSFALEGNARPGETLTVTLYWTSLRPPDADYTIFVHLLDEAGNFVLGDDGVPLDGRFPTRGLLPDRATPDTHPLNLPPDLPPGTYQIQAGVYLPETGVRLTAVNAAGETAPNQSLFLQTINIAP